ncbi:MAG: methionine adenosyltransferase domain-containing protein [Alphaproteobacteria bacterium]|nr:methionine adenosyltransferase domain-containing protein [Alphaproteobacteria bacterium]
MKISEYVSLGHPDKIADYISEYILDSFIMRDPNVRYAVEVQIKDNHVSLAGELTTTASALTTEEWHLLVEHALEEIGYTQGYCNKWGAENTIDPSKLTVDVYISTQSPDIAQGVNNDGWGDQGIFWGMACHETPDMLPLDYVLAKRLGDALYENARAGAAPWGLDIKTQFVLSDLNKVQKIIVAAPCKEEDLDRLKQYVTDWTVHQVCQKLDNRAPEIIINGTGAYIKHASIGDCGTTGRKLAVDFYGGNCRIGGGCPWTKDPTKADLTLNLAARILAIDALKIYCINTAYVSIGCCIGRPEIDVTVYDGLNTVMHTQTIKKTPTELIKGLELKKPIYAHMCRWGMWNYIDSVRKGKQNGQTEEETSGR